MKLFLDRPDAMTQRTDLQSRGIVGHPGSAGQAGYLTKGQLSALDFGVGGGVGLVGRSRLAAAVARVGPAGVGALVDRWAGVPVPGQRRLPRPRGAGRPAAPATQPGLPHELLITEPLAARSADMLVVVAVDPQLQVWLAADNRLPSVLDSRP